jgi:hypothetical protein
MFASMTIRFRSGVGAFYWSFRADDVAYAKPWSQR